MSFEEFITPTTVAGVGFPMALSVYLLMRIEKTLKELTVAILSLQNGKRFK